MERRSDQVTAMLLNAAINAAKGCVTLLTADELARLGIPRATFERVLAKPEERRRFLDYSSDIGKLL